MLTDLLRLQLDFLATRAELGAAVAGSWLLNRVTPNGGGNRPVVTIPGFMGSGATMLRLNRYLNQHGFEAHGWGMGRNVGPQGETWNAMLDKMDREVGSRIRSLADQHSAPVSLVGQSLGGVCARELATIMPDEIDRVIMLGSPTLHPYIKDYHNRVVAAFGYWLHRQSHAELAGRRGLLHMDPDDPPLPCVSIHSPCDGVVEEESAIIPQYIVDAASPGSPRENLRVFSSHIGMAVNPWVLLAIADRLVQDRENWEPFNPARYFTDVLKPVIPALYPAAKTIGSREDIASLAESRT